MSAFDSDRPKSDAATALGEAAKIYSRHAFAIVGVSILIQTIALVATFFVIDGGLLMTAISRLIPLTAGMLLAGALTIVLLSVRETGTVPPMSELVTRALPKVPRLFLLAWATGILVGVASLALLLPGLYVYVRLALAPSMMIMSGKGVNDSIKASWAITADAKWSVFVLVLFQGFCTFGISYLAYKAAGGAFAAEENAMIAEAFITALLVPIPTLAFGDLTLRLSGIYPDPVTGLRMSTTSDGPAHRVHVPGGAAPMPGNQVVAPQASPVYGEPASPYVAPQAAPAYGVPKAVGPLQPQPQSLWNRSPQPQAQTHAPAAHPHFSEAPTPPYVPAATAPPASPYAPPPPLPQPQPHAHQPYAQPQPQPHAHQPYAPPQPQPYAPPQSHQPYAPQPAQTPAPPTRTASVAPPGMG